MIGSNVGVPPYYDRALMRVDPRFNVQCALATVAGQATAEMAKTSIRKATLIRLRFNSDDTPLMDTGKLDAVNIVP